MPPKSKPSTKKTTNKKNVESPKVAHTANTNAETMSALTQEAEDQFELELCWCIQQLEMCLATGKLPEKQVHDLGKNISILKSNTAPLIKKRQVMRNTLGNYREKMALDEQKLGRAASSIKFVQTPVENKKCMFFKKAVHNHQKEKQHTNSQTASSNLNKEPVDIDSVQSAFKFNFQVAE